jgi:hypothetical protein
VFEGGLEAWVGGIDLDKGCFEASSLVASSGFDPYREKVAEEMLLCEVIVQFKICKHYEEICL